MTPVAFNALVAEARINSLLDELDTLRQEFHAYKVTSEKERELLEQERDAALLSVDRLSYRLQIAHGEGGK